MQTFKIKCDVYYKEINSNLNKLTLLVRVPMKFILESSPVMFLHKGDFLHCVDFIVCTVHFI